MTDERVIAEARCRLTVVACGLATKFGADQAAALLTGAATGLLLSAHGEEKAAEFFHATAAAIVDGDDSEVAGHA